MSISILVVVFLYFALLMGISYFTAKKGSDNKAFFLAGRNAPWIIVAIGMLGDSISGVTFVSVPGMVGQMDMTYMQMVLGFFPGYLIVAFVLLPLYYKLNLTTIYGYLDQRFGFYSYKTGASFFILSRLVGSASKLYLVALILQALVFDQWDVPFYLTVTGIILMIWLYTHRSGMKAIVWTDALQTVCLLLALILIIWQVVSRLDLDLPQAFSAVTSSEHSRIFVFDDWGAKNNFFKQFLSGILIVIAMTGLDQNMMQKNLACRNLRDAQKNMVSYGFGFIPMNYLFLALGILLLLFASKNGITLPEKSDEILPMLVTQYLGFPVLVFFVIGIVAASFSNADSALTSLTTSVSVDLFGVDRKDEKQAVKMRSRIHVAVCLAFLIVTLLIHQFAQNSILDTIYTLASYTYGPLLGLYFVGLFTKIKLRDKFVPYVCVAAPLVCYATSWGLKIFCDYTVGYEILLFNAMLTVVGLYGVKDKK